MDVLPFADGRNADHRPALPVPARKRWQPLRLGLVEMFHYDSEEFWFRDGHLLLRGNNGTGKSKVLSLTLPFLFDAQLKPSRIEPDGDGGKRMNWNLLVNSYDRRTGYTWIEFGRLAEDGTPHYLTLGAGLAAAAARPQVDSWYFIIEDAADALRLNRDLWLTSPQRNVLGKERLKDALADHGQVYETGKAYRRAVDERLFRLGNQRYDALMDTLVQLRQPQLSKRPDEKLLSDALTEALPPLPATLIADVADALGQLEEDRRQLETYEALAKAVERFESRYRVYAGTRSRREAQLLRNAQTEFDTASRLRNETRARFEGAAAEEARTISVEADAERDLTRERSRLDTLRADPRNQDANRLVAAEKDAVARQAAVTAATDAASRGKSRLQRDADALRRMAEQVSRVEGRLDAARRSGLADADTAGIADRYAANPLAHLAPASLAATGAHVLDRARADLRRALTERRDQIVLIRQRLAELALADAALDQARGTRGERRAEAETATTAREQADAKAEAEGQHLIEAWNEHLGGLKQLVVAARVADAALAALGTWVGGDNDENPARAALATAQQAYNLAHARAVAALEDEQRRVTAERQSLDVERAQLMAGIETGPPVPHTRNSEVRAGRQGAPLWQLVDFRATAAATERAGLEAALEASGLLDAWVSPDGQLQTGTDGKILLDAQALQRAAVPGSLAKWLQPAPSAASTVSPEVIAGLLSAIACADSDPADVDAWISPDGRYRLGSLAGAWAKTEASFIGFAARAAARARRLAAIDQRVAEISQLAADLTKRLQQRSADLAVSVDDWRGQPADESLLAALREAVACGRAAQAARERLAEADSRFAEAEALSRGLRERVLADAADMRVPATSDELAAVDDALQRYNDGQIELVTAVNEVCHALPEYDRVREREAEARDDLQAAAEHLSAALLEAEAASGRLAVLSESLGASIDELRAQLTAAERAVTGCEAVKKSVGVSVREWAERRAVTAEKAASAEQAFEQRHRARTDGVARFQTFASTGLLQAGWPEAALPDPANPWTIDPALALARRTEQALAQIRHDEDAWTRVQRDVQSDFAELQRALSKGGHHAHGLNTDWGLVVHVVYQGRQERPDRLLVALAEEISERNAMLSAKEREVLENHLEAEIASEIQRLLQAADRQRNAVNAELHKRPTSTGVRYRLLWQSLGEDEGAPVGFEEARKRLLNTDTDLWSADDRRVVGAMLQSRIAAERARADSGEADGSAALADTLARALDYRRWHRFRIERWQDGNWRRLSGPASSGERALGLTVPLFAAVASFYGESNGGLAPRLILLDEAFAGIDDAARGHCMALIREFDLDFVITSEREWACYADLPGVAICQLQRKEGNDAIFVSRWSWDGKDKAKQPDPDRRFAPDTAKVA